MNHKGREIVELRTFCIKETVGSRSRITKPTLIAIPRTAPRISNANNSAFQLSNFGVSNSATAVTGAIDACAKSARIVQLRKSLVPVLAWSLDSNSTMTSIGIVRKNILHESQGVLFT
jgi:hypothetical protein